MKNLCSNLRIFMQLYFLPLLLTHLALSESVGSGVVVERKFGDGHNNGVSNASSASDSRPILKPWRLPTGIYRYEDFGNPNKTYLLPTGEDLDKWTPPYNMSKLFPVYLAGYDYEDRPFWVVEFSKWDMVRALVSQNVSIDLLQFYIIQACHRLVTSARLSAEGKMTALADFDNLKISQFSHKQILQLWVNWAQEYERYMTKYLHDVFAINVNYTARTLFLMFKPVLGGGFQPIDGFGSKRSTWQPRLFQRVPQKYIPPQYGGSRAFKPIKYP